MVTNYTEANDRAKGAQNREQRATNTIRELTSEMNELRGARTGDESRVLNKFINDDYFYKELNGKPKVSFAPIEEEKGGEAASSDPVDNIMNKRPNKSALKRMDSGCLGQ